MDATPVYLAVGSNLGDREGNCRTVVALLGEEIAIEAVSSLYETVPYGVTDQPPFLNLALAGRTTLEPRALLGLCKRVEAEVGRRPTYRWGPRVVDVDILLLGDRVVMEDDLAIPHRDMLQRSFVLTPLAEIAPDVMHPTAGRAIVELAAAVGSEGVRRTVPW